MCYRYAPASLVFLTLMILFSHLTYAQSLEWEHIFPTSSGFRPGLGYIFDSESAPDGTLYVISNRMFRSTNDGQSWEELPSVPDKIGSDDVSYELAIDSSGRVLLGFLVEEPNERSFSLYRSADKGETWEELPMPNSNNATAIAVGTDGTYFVGQQRTIQPLLRSTDEGRSWESVLSNGFSVNLHGLAVLPNGTLIGSFYNFKRGTHMLMRSEDNGSTWHDTFTKDNTLQKGIFSKFTPVDSSVVFAIYTSLRAPSNTIWSTDGGKTWEEIRLTEPYTDGGFFAIAPNRQIYFQTGQGLYVSNNSGMSWELIHDIVPQELALYITSDYTFVGIGTRGPYRSVDTGRTWTETNDGISLLTEAFITGTDSLLWGVTWAFYLYYIDLDNQYHFQQRIFNFNKRRSFVSSTKETICVITQDSIYLKNRWDKSFKAVSAYNKAVKNSAAILVRDTVEHLLIGSNNGQIFQLNLTTKGWISSFISPETNNKATQRIAIIDNRYVLAANQGKIFRTNINDLFLSVPQVTWTEVLEVDTGMIVSDLHALNNGTVACIAGNKLWYSNDYGATWNFIASPELVRRHLAVQILYDNRIVVSSETLDGEERIEYHLYTVEPSTGSWTLNDHGINSIHPIIDFAELRNGNIYALTYQSGIYRTYMTSSVTPVEPITGEFSLSLQLQPNPTSGKLLLIIDHIQTGHHQIVITNAVGQIVYRKSSLFLDKNNHNHSLDLSFFPSGLYHCEIISHETEERVSKTIQVLR